MKNCFHSFKDLNVTQKFTFDNDVTDLTYHSFRKLPAPTLVALTEVYETLQIELARPVSKPGNRLGRSVQGTQSNIMSQHNESYCFSSLNVAKSVGKFIKINAQKTEADPATLFEENSDCMIYCRSNFTN